MLVLHVGPHKTATTWLQSNFHRNARALEKAGWLYPMTGERVRIAHHDLSDNAKDILDPQSRKVALLTRVAERARAGNLNVLLSSEGFRHWTPSQIKALQKIFAPHEIRIVYCLRDPVSLLYSFWAQGVKTGSSASLPEFYARQKSQGKKSRVFNPLREIGRFTRAARGNLTVLLYDEIRKSGRDIFDVFAQDILGVSGLDKEPARGKNEQQPIEMTEFMRLVLKRIGTWKAKGQVNIGRVFQHMLTDARRMEIIATVGACRPKADRLLVVERDQRFLDRLEQKLLRQYRDAMIPAPGEKLFLTGPAALTYLDEAALLENAGVKGELSRISRRFRPGGLYMWVANWSRFWLVQWRRLTNRFR